MVAESSYLLPFAEPRFDLAEVSFPVVDGLGCARVHTSAYSVPLRAGTHVEAKVYSSYVEIWHEGQRVARHERSYSRQQQILDLEPYSDVLEKKPRAFAGSRPLEQRRRSGRWPDSFDRLWTELMKRHGKQPGTRQMINVLALGKQHGYDRLRIAVESALDSVGHDVSAVRCMVTADQQRRTELPVIELGLLGRYERPLPIMAAAADHE